MSKDKLTGVALVLGVALTLGASVYYRQISTAVASLRAPNAAAHSDLPQQPPAQEAAGASKGQRKILYWQDAMNPGMRSNKPGKAPDGMDLVRFTQTRLARKQVCLRGRSISIRRNSSSLGFNTPGSRSDP